MSHRSAMIQLCAAALTLQLAFVSCGGKDSVQLQSGKTPLVQVGNDVLYMEDIMQVMPLGVNADDSTAFVDRYVKDWVQDMLFYDKAKRNVQDTHEIDRMVENYRRSLLERQYQSLLIEQKFTSQITDADVDAFYAENGQLFKLENALVKCLFIKVSSGSKDLARIRKIYTRMDDASFEELEKLCIRNGARCEFHYDNWCPLDEIEILLPHHEQPLSSRIAGDTHFEFSDDENTYLLSVSGYIPKGGTEPIENARDRIRRLLVNSNEVEYIKSLREDLYTNALEKNRILFFSKTENDSNE